MSTIELNRVVAVGGIGAIVAKVFSILAGWNEVRQTRRELNSLSDRELDDLGLGRSDIGRIARGL